MMHKFTYTYFLSSRAALIAAFSSSVFSSAGGASVDMNLAVLLLLIDSCLHCCFDVWVMMGEIIDDEDTANGGTNDGALLDMKADAKYDEPLLPIAWRILADI